jgi:hypothetical protein
MTSLYKSFNNLLISTSSFLLGCIFLTTPIAYSASESNSVLDKLLIPPAACPISSKLIKVFFPKNPESYNDFSYSSPVYRCQPLSQNKYSYAMNQLTRGLRAGDISGGLFYAIKINMRATSLCPTNSNYRITKFDSILLIRFCKPIISNGVGDDARIINTVNQTMKQFSEIKKVVLLDQNWHCVGDMSGLDKCLD